MIVESALEYEFLIRRIYKCKRYEVNGADADLFRALINYEQEFEQEKISNGKIWTPESEEKIYYLGERIGMTKIYLLLAISKVEKDYDKYFSEQQKKDLDIIVNTILVVTEVKQIVDEINKANIILDEIGLEKPTV